MDKPLVECLELSPTVEPLPAAARAEAGVILHVRDSRRSTLRLAKDGHV